jgi:uncharacterized protein (UPF0210 family)
VNPSKGRSNSPSSNTTEALMALNQAIEDNIREHRVIYIGKEAIPVTEDRKRRLL